MDTNAVDYATRLGMKLRDRADRETDPLVSARLHSIANLSSEIVLERRPEPENPQGNTMRTEARHQ